MALIQSLSLPMGTKLEHFELEDPNGKRYSSKELYGKGGLLIAVV